MKRLLQILNRKPTNLDWIIFFILFGCINAFMPLIVRHFFFGGH